MSDLRGSDTEADNEVDISIIDLLKGILSGVNTSLGGLNNFRVLYSEDLAQIQIVSESPILSQKDGVVDSNTKKATINTFGFNTTDKLLTGGSFVTSVDLNSELTDQMATQISIGAQNNSNTVNGNSTSFSSYSKGLIDKLMVKKESTVKATSSAPTGISFEEWELAKTTASGSLISTNETIDRIGKILDASKYEEIFNNVYGLREFSNNEYISALEKITAGVSPLISGAYTQNGNSAPPFFLPFNMSLEMHGLAGMKIFNSFSINGRGLPISYNPSTIQLIIKSLSHTVSLNGWSTKIETLSRPVFGVKATSAVFNAPPGDDGVDLSGARENLNYKGEKLDYDPAPIINPTHIGASSPEKTPVFKARSLNLRSITSPSKIFALAAAGKLTLIGDATTNTNFTKGSPSLASVKLLNNKYYLDPTAAQQFKKWTDELNTNGIPWRCTSAVRFGGNTGGGAHGFGIAVDFGNLWRVVKGSHAPATNLPGRETKIYEDIATAGAKYGWYNPWRLSDVKGTYDEIWHFEYWGPA